jgi:hypothetical protein
MISEHVTDSKHVVGILHFHRNNNFLQSESNVSQEQADREASDFHSMKPYSESKRALGVGTVSYVSKRYFESNITRVQAIKGASTQTPTGRNHILSTCISTAVVLCT